MDEIITRDEPRAVPIPSAAINPSGLLAIAVEKGADVAQLQQLMELQFRWEANEARKAFVVALAAFKSNAPVVMKNKTVKFATSKGMTEYKHATLDSANEIITAALATHGLTHRWEVEQTDAGISVTCVLTHERGHAERITMRSGPDTSGTKNNIQAVGSTVSYLQRYTLLAATGLSAKDADDDGRQGAQGMTDGEKADFYAAIESLNTRPAAETLWKQIAAACQQAGDVASYEELKAAISKHVKTLPKEGVL